MRLESGNRKNLLDYARPPVELSDSALPPQFLCAAVMAAAKRMRAATTTVNRTSVALTLIAIGMLMLLALLR